MGLKKPVRVWSKDRKKRYGIVAKSLIDLKTKSATRFALSKEDDFCMVLEEDGSLLNDESFDTMKPETRVILLLSNEIWEPTNYITPYIDNKSGNISEDKQATELFKYMSRNEMSIHSFSLADLEIILDANVDKLELDSLKKEYAKKMQEMCEEIYDKKSIAELLWM